MTRHAPCPLSCPCLCHDTGGGVTLQHGVNGRCTTKDGLPLVDMQLSTVD